MPVQIIELEEVAMVQMSDAALEAAVVIGGGTFSSNIGMPAATYCCC